MIYRDHSQNYKRYTICIATHDSEVSATVIEPMEIKLTKLKTA